MKPLIKTLTLLSILTPSVVFSMGDDRQGSGGIHRPGQSPQDERGSGVSSYGYGYQSAPGGYGRGYSHQSVPSAQRHDRSYGYQSSPGGYGGGYDYQSSPRGYSSGGYGYHSH